MFPITAIKIIIAKIAAKNTDMAWWTWEHITEISAKLELEMFIPNDVCKRFSWGARSLDLT